MNLYTGEMDGILGDGGMLAEWEHKAHPFVLIFQWL